MNTSQQLLCLMILAAIGLFFILWKSSQPLLLQLINGPLSDIYLEFIKKNNRVQINAAFADSNADRAQAQLVFSKIEEMGSPKVPYVKREQNLKYIKASGIINRKLADELIRILPKQRSLEFQVKVATYISEVLTRLKDDTGSERNNVPEPVSKLFVQSWAFALSAWIAGALFFAASATVWDNLSVYLVFLLNFGLFILMLFPLFRLIFSGFAKFTSAVTIATAILVGMNFFAQTNHSFVDSKVIELKNYGFPEGALNIHYPLWLSEKNLTSCESSNHISFDIEDLSAQEVSFEPNPNNDSIVARRDDCLDDKPIFDISQNPFQTINFYLAPRDLSKLDDSRVVFTPVVKTASQESRLSQDTFEIRLEHWLWKLVSNVALQLGSLSATGILLILKLIAFNKPEIPR